MYVSIKMHHMPRTISNNAVATAHVAMRVRVCVCVCVQANLSDDENDETDDVVVGEKWVNPNAKPIATGSGAGNRRLSLADIEQTELASGNDLRSEMFGMSVSMHIHTHIPTDTGIRTPVDCHTHTPTHPHPHKPTPTHLHTHTHTHTSTRLR